jgi:hypothetical protein
VIPRLGLFWAGTLALSLLLLGAVWCVPYLPTNDGPESVFSAHVENHYSDPGTIYRDQLVPTYQFAGKGFSLVFAPLENLLGWRNALRATLSVLVLASAWGNLALVLAVDPRRRAAALLGFPLALSYPFYMGFYSFALGSALGLLTLAFVARRSPKTRWASLALLLLVQSVVHVFSAVLTAVAVFAVVVATAARGARGSVVWKAMLAESPVLLVLLGAAATTSKGQADFVGGFWRLPWRETLAAFPHWIAPGPSGRAWFVTALVVLAMALALARARSSTATSLERCLTLVSCAFFALALALPRDFPDWQIFSPRFIPLAVSLLLGLVPLELAARLGRRALDVAAALSFVVSVALLVSSALFHRRLARECEDVVAAIDAPVQRSRLVLPVNLEPRCGFSGDPSASEVPFDSPLLHIGALFAAVQGGSTPYLFAGSASAHAFKVREGGMVVPPIPDLHRLWPLFASEAFKTDDTLRRRSLDEIAQDGIFYEAVAVTGLRPGDLSVWEERGFVADWTRGSVLLAHFEPCSLDLTFPRDVTTLPEELEVGLGAHRVFRGAPGPARAFGESVDLAVERAPCGRIWVRPVWADTARSCTNAAASGKIYATVTRGDGHVECQALRAALPAGGL